MKVITKPFSSYAAPPILFLNRAAVCGFGLWRGKFSLSLTGMRSVLLQKITRQN